ncbi:hypothetical protein TO66_06125 [Pseudomonas sp. MRSN 12121]|nr:hypothetical protein TO66_06125 [Pseudomonas sp. MRSN 12121]
MAQPTPETEWAAIRTRRDQLLQASDFTQLVDYPITDAQRAEVAAYRKALRDLPEREKEPSKLVWPERPAFVN